MVADRERRRTYAAEDRAFTGTLAEEPLTFAEVVEVVQAVTASAWWQTTGGGAVRVERGRPGMVHSRHLVGTDRIVITEVQQTPATVAHELAHRWSADVHGPRFRGALVALVMLICGAEAAGALAAEFAADGLTVADAPAVSEPALLATHPRFGA